MTVNVFAEFIQTLNFERAPQMRSVSPETVSDPAARGALLAELDRIERALALGYADAGMLARRRWIMRALR